MTQHGMETSPPNTLFSSSSCKYCILFLKELNKNFLINEFNIIDVEKTAFDVSKVKVVPTIVVNNNRALSGRDAFAWLQNQLKSGVSGVESFGISSAYTYIGTDKAECSMSSMFVDVDEAPGQTDLSYETENAGRHGGQEASRGGKSDKESDIQQRLAQLRQERGV